MVNEAAWGFAVQMFGEWKPMGGEHWKKINALIAARKHIRRCKRFLHDPRNIAIFCFDRGQFDEVPWV